MNTRRYYLLLCVISASLGVSCSQNKMREGVENGSANIDSLWVDSIHSVIIANKARMMAGVVAVALDGKMCDDMFTQCMRVMQVRT